VHNPVGVHDSEVATDDDQLEILLFVCIHFELEYTVPAVQEEFLDCVVARDAQQQIDDAFLLRVGGLVLHHLKPVLVLDFGGLVVRVDLLDRVVVEADVVHLVVVVNSQCVVASGHALAHGFSVDFDVGVLRRQGGFLLGDLVD